MHAHCTEKRESQSLQQVQCDNELFNDTIKAHCSHTIITELLKCDVQPVNQHWHVIYVVMELDRKKRINMKSDHLHLNSDKTQFIRVGSRQQLASVSVTKIVLKDSASRHRPSSRVLASRSMPSWHSPMILDACEADRSMLFLSASPTVVHPTSSYFRQCYNANPRSYCQSHTCNSVLFQTAAVHLRPLQSVMNAAARLVVRRGSPTALRRLCVTLYIGSWFENE